MATKPIGSDPGKRGLMQGVFRGDFLNKLRNVPGKKAKSEVSRDVVKSDILDPVVKGKERRRLINETIIFWETYFKMLPKEEGGLEEEEDCCDPCAQFPGQGSGGGVAETAVVTSIIAGAILGGMKVWNWIRDQFPGGGDAPPASESAPGASAPGSTPAAPTTTAPPWSHHGSGGGGSYADSGHRRTPPGSDFLTRQGKTIPISKADDMMGLQVGGPLADILRSLPNAVARGDKETQELLLELIAMGRQEVGLPRRGKLISS